MSFQSKSQKMRTLNIFILLLLLIHTSSAQQLQFRNLAKDNKFRSINTGEHDQLVLDYQVLSDSVNKYYEINSNEGYILSVLADSIVFISESYSKYAYLNDSMFYIQDTMLVAKKDIQSIRIEKPKLMLPNFLAGISFTTLLLAPVISFNFPGVYFNKNLYLYLGGISTAVTIVSLTAVILQQRNYYFVNKDKPLKKLWKIE